MTEPYARPLEPYARLLALARLERELVVAGDWEALAAVGAEQAALRGALPDRPPPLAVPLLEEAARLGATTARIIESRLEDVREELVGLGRGRTALAGYAGPAAVVAELDWQG